MAIRLGFNVFGTYNAGAPGAKAQGRNAGIVILGFCFLRAVILLAN